MGSHFLPCHTVTLSSRRAVSHSSPHAVSEAATFAPGPTSTFKVYGKPRKRKQGCYTVTVVWSGHVQIACFNCLFYLRDVMQTWLFGACPCIRIAGV